MKYKSNGDYAINKLVLRYKPSDSETKELDLSVAFVSVDIFESLFDQTMSGSISIIDSLNLPDTANLYGGEEIDISFNTLGTEDLFEYKAIVYKISENHRISEHASGYTIYFISPEALKSTRLSTNISGKKQISSFVESIFNKRLKEDKPLVAEQTEGIFSYVFGVHKPFNAINILRNAAYGDDLGYLFYEDNRQFNFVPVEKLKQQEPVKDYFYRNRGVFKEIDQKEVESFNSIQELEVLEENSLLDRTMEGIHGKTSVQFDLFSKEATKVEYDKEGSWNSEKSLSEVPHKNEVDVSYESRVRLGVNNNSSLNQRKAVSSVMKLIELSTIRVKIVVFGDSTIRVGQACNVTLPNWNQEQQEVKNKIDGKYLIGQIHHNLSNTKMTQTMMLFKDGYSK
tara:strand:- start:12053 stop:13246 length:1194 start_codon:yes stop_codon:yes gene_type:complete